METVIGWGVREGHSVTKSGKTGRQDGKPSQEYSHRDPGLGKDDGSGIISGKA